ncbi:MAG: hypothetical protein AB1589_36435 [Cyanobacteriota bacterium]
MEALQVWYEQDFEKKFPQELKIPYIGAIAKLGFMAQLHYVTNQEQVGNLWRSQTYPVKVFQNSSH